jgi:putative PIN family toxin of toxin-antitoxin system
LIQIARGTLRRAFLFVRTSRVDWSGNPSFNIADCLDTCTIAKIALVPTPVSPTIPQVYAVLDTSVLVSGLRSRQGASYAVLGAIRSGDVQIAVSVGLVLEYESVALRRGLIPHFNSEEIQTIIDVFCRLAHQQRVFYTWRPFLADPDDDLVLELAVAAGVGYIITHNTSDFSGSESMGVRIVTPAEALNLI